MADSVPVAPRGASQPTSTLPASALSAATASKAGPDTVGFRSSGQSPGRTLHLIGPGRVGRAFLRQLDGLGVVVVAVSDASATVFDRGGLPLAALVAHKQAGASLATWPRAERIPTELAVGLVGADVVVDATPTSRAGTEAALQRGRAALRGGAFLALCAKNALASATGEWLLGPHRGRVGIDAVLGGAGRALVRELAELRQHCRALALVGNVTTTVLVQAIEQGASIDEGIAEAQARGLLEPDPSLDLDGSDAATKLCAVWGAVFGETWAEPPAIERVQREDLRALDAALLRERARRGATTRLVARGSRAGTDLRVRFEEVPQGSPLAAPPDRVVYGYELGSGLRLHTGLAVGHERTAAALRGDVAAALAAWKVRS